MAIGNEGLKSRPQDKAPQDLTFVMDVDAQPHMLSAGQKATGEIRRGIRKTARIVGNTVAHAVSHPRTIVSETVDSLQQIYTKDNAKALAKKGAHKAEDAFREELKSDRWAPGKHRVPRRLIVSAIARGVMPASYNVSKEDKKDFRDGVNQGRTIFEVFAHGGKGETPRYMAVKNLTFAYRKQLSRPVVIATDIRHMDDLQIAAISGLGDVEMVGVVNQVAFDTVRSHVAAHRKDTSMPSWWPGGNSREGIAKIARETNKRFNTRMKQNADDGGVSWVAAPAKRETSLLLESHAFEELLDTAKEIDGALISFNGYEIEGREDYSLEVSGGTNLRKKYKINQGIVVEAKALADELDRTGVDKKTAVLSILHGLVSPHYQTDVSKRAAETVKIERNPNKQFGVIVSFPKKSSHTPEQQVA